MLGFDPQGLLLGGSLLTLLILPLLFWVAISKHHAALSEAEE